MRGIREYADVLYPEVTIINDDLDTWKQDCSAVLEEAKWNNPNKKIFACIMTNYFNKTGTIPETMKLLPMHTSQSRKLPG